MKKTNGYYIAFPCVYITHTHTHTHTRMQETNGNGLSSENERGKPVKQ